MSIEQASSDRELTWPQLPARARWRTLFYDRSPVAETQWVQYRAIELLIRARDDLLWFHGAAAGYAGRAVAFPGRRGRGNSTLVTSLWLQGWTFLTDDILPVDPRSDQVLPFPRPPAARLDPGRDLPDEELRRVPKKEGGALPLAAIVLPEARRRGPTELADCSIGEAVLALLDGCGNFARHREAALRYLATLDRRLPVCRLSFANPTIAADLLTRWAEGKFGPKARPRA